MTQKKDKKGKSIELNKVPTGHSSESERHRTQAIQSATAGGTIGINHILRVDGRGMMVIPKEVRDKLDIVCGGEFMLLTRVQTGMAPIIILIPDDQLFGKTKSE